MIKLEAYFNEKEAQKNTYRAKRERYTHNTNEGVLITYL